MHDGCIISYNTRKINHYLFYETENIIINKFKDILYKCNLKKCK